MKKADHQRAKLLNRVKRIKGQVEAIERALSDDQEECADTLQLLAACRGAINGLMGEVLEGHIKDHIAGGKRWLCWRSVHRPSFLCGR